MTYPFTLSATSLTYSHRSLLFNLEHLPQEFSGIEVMLEYPLALPWERSLSRDVEALIKTKKLSVTVHLPLSLQLASANPWLRRASLAALQEAVETVAHLKPEVHVLHVGPFVKEGTTALGPYFELNLQKSRRQAAAASLEALAQMVDTRDIAIENLQDNFAAEGDLVERFDFAVCMDVGHLLLSGGPVFQFFERHRKRIRVIHLHDVEGRFDHRPLGSASSALELVSFCALLQESEFQGTVVLELFDPEYLVQSQIAFRAAWEKAALYSL